MTDIPLTPRQQITQAIQILQQSGNQSAITRHATEVLVTQLSGNLLTITTPKGQRSIAIGQQNRPLQVSQGQKYQASINTKGTNQVLELFSQKNPNTPPLSIAINGSQLASILSLPLAGQQIDTNAAPLVVKAKVLSVSGRTLALSVPTPSGTSNVQLSVTNPDAFQRGQTVNVQLTPIADKWQVSLLAAKSPTRFQAPAAPTAVSEVSVENAKTLITSHFFSDERKAKLTINVPASGLLKVLPEIAHRLPQRHLAQAQTLPLQIASNPNGKAALSVQIDSKQSPPAPLLTVPLSKEDVKKLSKLAIPQSEIHSERSSLTGVINPQTSKQEASTIRAQADLPPIVDKAAAKANHRATVEQLVRVLLPQTTSPSEALQKLDNILRQAASTSPEAPSQQLFSNVQKLVESLGVQGDPDDVSKVRQYFSLPATPVSISNIMAAAPATGIVNALVSLLQLTMSARLSRQKPEMTEQLVQTLTRILSGSSKNAPPTAKSLADLGALEQRHNLLKLVGKVLTQHQLSKLVNAEQQVQNQDTFFYALPSALGTENNDIELLIRREKDNQKQGNKDKGTATTWHLTMKLSVDARDTMLAKAKIKAQHLDLDLYTSSDSSKNRVLEYLPWLKKRLSGLGIEVGHWQCSRGVIPDTLQDRPYHIFQTQV